MRLHRLSPTCLFTMIVLLTARVAEAQTGPDDPRNLIGLEVLGRAGIYSVNYERLVTPRIAVGIGFARWSVSGGFFSYAKTSTVHLPMYVSWNPLGDIHSLYIAAGSTMSLSKREYLSTRSSFQSTVMGTATLGYQFRSLSGFLVRPSVSYLSNDRGIFWPGLTIGLTF
jgi:hypothetical protein